MVTKVTESRDAVMGTFMRFVQAAETVLKYGDFHFYKEANTSMVKFGALHILHANGGTLSHTELASQMYKEPHTVTTLIDRLKREGLVKTNRRPENRRFIDITLTKRGREKLEEAVPIAEKIAFQIMDSLDDKKAAELKASFDSFKRNALDGLERLKKGE